MSDAEPLKILLLLCGAVVGAGIGWGFLANPLLNFLDRFLIKRADKATHKVRP